MNSKLLFVTCLLLSGLSLFPQQREASPLVYEKSYSYTEIHKSLREVINQSDKAAYFNDAFFNGMLRKVIDDKQFTDPEKVQLFYLMLQKLGYGFTGVEYIPPRQSYFAQHLGKVYVFEGMAKSLKGVALPVSRLIAVMESHMQKDVLLASNALLLATLMNSDSLLSYIEKYSMVELITRSKYPAIINHYLCLSASLAQNETIVKNLRKNLLDFKKEEMIEDVICALYSKNNPVSAIKEYIVAESDPANELAIQTALNALAHKVPKASYQESVKSLLRSVPEKWKQNLLDKLLRGAIPFDYSLTSPDALVTKVWDGVVLSTYTNGSLVSFGELMEFDPN